MTEYYVAGAHHAFDNSPLATTDFLDRVWGQPSSWALRPDVDALAYAVLARML